MTWLALNLPGRISNAELYRNQLASDTRNQASLKAIDDRITGSLANTMRADVAQLIYAEHDKRITALEQSAVMADTRAWSTRSTLLVGMVSAGASSALTVLITLIVAR